MKKAADTLVRVLAAVLAVLSVSILLFTLVSTLFFNRTDREFFGYKAFIVLSDSMSATDFSAGDLVLIRQTDPETMQPGDIIAFVSRNDANYGDTVTHKIRAVTTTADGAPGFVTYGTTTDTDDEAVVPYTDVLGRYVGHIPKVGAFFNFLKSTPGYLLCIFLPFMLLILSQAVQTAKLFRAYKREQMQAIEAERSSLQAQAEENRRMRAELQQMRQTLAQSGETTGFTLPATQSGADVAARLADGGEVTLQEDVAFTDESGTCIDCVVAPGKAAVLHLNGCRLKGTIQLADGAALTVDGEGCIQATGRSHSRVGCPIYARGHSSRAVLYSGSYLGGAGSCAVCAAGGTITVCGGSFAVKGDSAAHLLYCTGGGQITVEGGSFAGYNPGPHLAPGKRVAANQTESGTVYTVE